MVIPTFPTMVSGAPVIAAHLKRIGITMEIENVEYAVWIKRWLAKDFDMTMNTTPGYADPDTAFFRALHSTKGQNWNSWSVPALDALLEDGRRTMDQRKRKEIYDRVQLMILENVPHLWLFSAETIDFTQNTVKGFRQHPTTLLYGFEGVWLDTAVASVASTPPAPVIAPRPEPTARPVRLDLGRYHALIIGNQKYLHLTSLKTPSTDARAIADVLRRDYKFDSVSVLLDAKQVEMLRALDRLRKTLAEADNLLIFYAGHGIFVTPRLSPSLRSAPRGRVARIRRAGCAGA
jgi:hypothetical protein